jgi:hypothetical protein
MSLDQRSLLLSTKTFVVVECFSVSFFVLLDLMRQHCIELCVIGLCPMHLVTVK